MPQLLLIIGLIILVFVAVNYFKQADPKKLATLSRYVVAAVLAGLGLFILLRGNVYVALVLATGAVLAWQGTLWNYLAGRAGKNGGNTSETNRRSGRPSMAREEALEVLGLKGHPTVTEIKEAHHKLIRKIHPDQGGSDYLAMKINDARDVLLNEYK
ncbi:hypothetical protein [Emcibacter nanhaiensis]|uniref:J domain-containing protein n=1 Tax=Emcibacter nanhaiensis TaxID=1505037 RepID=A0A501PT95_9PROT|nr:hypothetical protein [Emcibacter nanhaiensis]TPD63184.1 hypothetical protein FIV46_03660 [Emcibacter nanhaiensis]